MVFQEGLVERVFRRDYKTLIDIDLFEMIEGLRSFTGSGFADKVILKVVLDPLKQMSHVLNYLELEYFKYDERRFPNPIDQYIYIHESKEKIMELINKTQPKTALTDIVAFTLYKRISWRIQRVCDLILMRGKEHMFEPDNLNSLIDFGCNGVEIK